jgi:hypothetical protein
MQISRKSVKMSIKRNAETVCVMDLSDSRNGPVSGFRERDNKPSNSIKAGEYFH